MLASSRMTSKMVRTGENRDSERVQKEKGMCAVQQLKECCVREEQRNGDRGSKEQKQQQKQQNM
jgi:hypothetical protein